MRKETDSMGNMNVPDDAYYGAQTQRAIQNFKVSNIKLPESMIEAIGIIKKYASVVNFNLGLLDKDRKNAIVKASNEIIKGKYNLNKYL